MRQVEFLKKLKALDKPYFTVSDLQMVLGQAREAARKDIHRFVKRGVLKRIGKNVYVSPFSSYDIEEIAASVYAPCYLSFESALSKYGVLGQVPYTITFATTRRSKKLMLENLEIEFRRLKPELFFGYKLIGKLPIAEPEKALLDELYLVSLGKAKLDLKEASLRELSFEKTKRLGEKFPATVQKKLTELKPRWKEVTSTVR